MGMGSPVTSGNDNGTTIGTNGSPGPLIFLSYDTENGEMARELRTIFVEEGFRVWMAPDDIRGPRSWAEQIDRAISEASVLAVLISSNANQSSHVGREVSLALEQGKPVLPIRIEDVAVSGTLRYLLTLVQWVDAFPPPLRRHRERVTARVLDLLDDLGLAPTAVDRSTAPPTPPSRWTTRSALAVGAGILAVAAITTAVLLRPGPDPPPTDTTSSSTTAAPASTTVPPTTVPSDDPLLAIPQRLGRLADLGPHLVEIAAHYELPAGNGLTLVDESNERGSIAVQVPVGWADVDRISRWLDGDDETIGDIFIAASDISRFYRWEASGLFVGAATPRPPEPLLDNRFVDTGCLSSGVLDVAAPIPGEVRVWADCDDDKLFLTADLNDSTVRVDLFAIAGSIGEAQALASALASLEVVPALVRGQPGFVTDSDGLAIVEIPSEWTGLPTAWEGAVDVDGQQVMLDGVRLELWGSESAFPGTRSGEWIRVSVSPTVGAALSAGDALFTGGVAEVLAQVSGRQLPNDVCDSRVSFTVPAGQNVVFAALGSAYQGIVDTWIGCEFVGSGTDGRWYEGGLISTDGKAFVFIDMLILDNEESSARAADILASLQVEAG